MRTIVKIPFFMLIVLIVTACNQSNLTPPQLSSTKEELKLPENQNKKSSVRIFKQKDSDYSITTQSIKASFASVGLSIVSENDLNKAFETRFGILNYKAYFLSLFMNHTLSYKLIQKYPKFGLLTPLSMSMWVDNKNSVHIATLSLSSMAKIANIPKDDKDLIAYSRLIDKALYTAMPYGKFQELSDAQSSDIYIKEYKKVMKERFSSFESEFEDELSMSGFFIPYYLDIKSSLFVRHDYNEYDFFYNYAICELDTLYKLSKLHPQMGAWSPCSLYMYRKTGDKNMVIGFIPSVVFTEKRNALYESQGIVQSTITQVLE